MAECRSLVKNDPSKPVVTDAGLGNLHECGEEATYAVTVEKLTGDLPVWNPIIFCCDDHVGRLEKILQRGGVTKNGTYKILKVEYISG